MAISIRLRRFKIVGIALVVPLLLVTLLLAFRAHAAGREESIQVGEHLRTYRVHAPETSAGNRPLPLVIAFHGHYGTGAGMASMTRFNDVADKHGFIVAYPDGYHRSWGDARGTTPADVAGIDDVAFTSAMIDKISKEYTVDPDRIYATGMSNGGFFSQRLACDLSDRIAAVAVVASTLSERLSVRCQPDRPISVMIIMGTADPLVPWNGGEMRKGSGGMVLSAEDSAKKWADINSCNETPEIKNLSARVRSETYSRCKDGTEVVLNAVQDAGHTWPGGRPYLPEFIVGKVSRELDADEVIWSFFQKHPK